MAQVQDAAAEDLWAAVADSSQVDDEGTLPVVYGDEEACVYKVDSQYFATSNQCTHGKASLAEGMIDGYLIECPLHEGMFDIRTGKAMSPPCTRDLKCFDVKVEAGTIYLRPQSNA